MALRFMVMVKGDRDHEAGLPPKPELAAAIGELSEAAPRAQFEGCVITKGERHG